MITTALILAAFVVIVAAITAILSRILADDEPPKD